MTDECLFYKQSLDFWRYECDVFGDYFADEMENNIYGFEKCQKRAILLGSDINKQIDILCTDIILSRIEPLIEIEDYDGLVTIFEVVVNMIIQQAIAALKWKCNLQFCNDDNASDIESRIQNAIMIYPTIIPDIEFKVTRVLDTTIKGIESIFNHKNLKLPMGLIECLKCISDAGISSWMSKKDKEEKKKNVMYVLSTKCKFEQYIADESKYNQYKLARKFVKDNNIYLPQMYMMFFNTLALIKKCEGKEYPLIGSDKFVEEKYKVVKNLFQPGSIYESILHVRPYDDPSYGLRVTNFFSGMLPSFISARKFNYKLVDPGLVNYLELKVRRSRIGIGLPDDNINAYVFSTT